jgi:hypothetical protein
VLSTVSGRVPGFLVKWACWWKWNNVITQHSRTVIKELLQMGGRTTWEPFCHFFCWHGSRCCIYLEGWKSFLVGSC